jgi:hypothetical protein
VANLAPLFNFGAPAILLRPRPTPPAVVQAPPPPPGFGGSPVPVSGGGAPIPTCPEGTAWDPYAQACIAVAAGPTVGGNFPVTTTTTLPGTTVNVPAGAGAQAGGGEGPITVNVANAVSLTDASAASAIDSVAAAVRNGILAGTNAAASSTNASIQAVQYGIDNLTTQLATGINQGFTDIANVATGLGNAVDGALTNITGVLTNEIFNYLTPVSSGLAQIVQILANQIGGLAGQIAQAVAQIIPQIVGVITAGLNPITAVLQTISNEIGQNLADLVSGPVTYGGAIGGLDATLGRILTDWETYNTGFVEAQTGYPDNGTLHKDLSGIVAAIAGLVTSVAGGATLKVSDRISTVCAGADIQQLMQYGADFGDLEQGIVKQFIKAFWDWAMTVLKVLPVAFKYWEEVRISADQSCPNERLAPAAIVDALLRGYLTPTQAQSEAAQGNLNADRLKVLTDLASHQMTPGELVEALFRGVIQQADYAAALAAQGWTPNQQQILQSIGVNLLNLTELWELMRRGAIDAPTQDAALKALHYDDAQRKALASLTFRPANMNEAIGGAAASDALAGTGASALANLGSIPEFVQVAAAAEGLSTDATTARWYEHWSTGSLNLWVDLYFRGQASYQEVQSVFRRSFVPDPITPRLIDASRPLLQFRTISRMVFLKLLTPEQGKAQLLKHGYSDADAQTLINYALVSGKAATAQRAQTQHAVSIGIAKEEYIDGSISAAQFYDILVAHNFTPEGANTEIAVIDAHQAMLLRKANAQLVVDEYGAGLINEQVALAQLAAQGLTAAELAKYAHKIRAFRTKNAKLPTEAELLKMLKAGIITTDDYVNTLIGQGYSAKWANAFLQLGTQPTAPAGSTASATAASPAGP